MVIDGAFTKFQEFPWEYYTWPVAVCSIYFLPLARLKKGHESVFFLMSSMRFLAFKWGFKVRHKGESKSE